MKLHLFKSGRQIDVVGFTPDGTGANLPANLAPWTHFPRGAEIDLGPDALPRAASGASGSIAEAVEREGFCVASIAVIEQLTGVPWIC